MTTARARHELCAVFKYAPPHTVAELSSEAAYKACDLGSELFLDNSAGTGFTFHEAGTWYGGGGWTGGGAEGAAGGGEGPGRPEPGCICKYSNRN
jgi:hypothetical protein